MEEEEESEISRIDREGRKRREMLDSVLKEIQLFDMNKDISEDEKIEEEQSIDGAEECSNELNAPLPGIKFFYGHPNRDYNQDYIKSEISAFKHCSKLDLESITELKDKVLNGHIIENFTDRQELFKSVMKLLFTCQSRSFLEEASKILIVLAKKPNQAFPLLNIVIDTLPIGLKNLGGKVRKIFAPSQIENLNIPLITVDEEQNFCLVENIRYVVHILQYTLKKANLHLKGEPNLPSKTLDDLVFALIVVSQDPQILNSNVIPSIQNCLAQILESYSSDYKSMIQDDIVERIIRYWEDCAEGFSHVVAYTICCDVIPSSVRGKYLKASLAYCSLLYCLPEQELSLLDKVPVSTLSKCCHDNVSTLSSLDYQTLYSVMRLIDAAIVRPVSLEVDKDHVTSLISTMEEILSSSSSNLQEDWYHKPKLESLMKELMMQWNKLIVTSKEATNLY